MHDVQQYADRTEYRSGFDDCKGVHEKMRSRENGKVRDSARAYSAAPAMM